MPQGSTLSQMHKKGAHLQSMLHESSIKASIKPHFVSVECTTTIPEEVDEESYKMFTLRDKSSEPIIVKCLLNSVPTDMEYYTGASLSTISQDTYAQVSKSSCIGNLEKTEVKLKNNMGESIPVLGKIRMHVKHEDQEEVLPVLVVKGTGPNLMGRDWLNKIKVNFCEVYSLTNKHPLEKLLKSIQLFLRRNCVVWKMSKLNY